MSAFLLSTDIVSITAYVRKVNLSTETQTQIAQILAALIRRVQAIAAQATHGDRSGGLAVRNHVGDFCHATVDCVACAPLVDLHHATPFVLRSKVLKQLAQKPLEAEGVDEGSANIGIIRLEISPYVKQITNAQTCLCQAPAEDWRFSLSLVPSVLSLG